MNSGDRYLVKTMVFQVNKEITLKKDDLVIFLEVFTKGGSILVKFWNHYSGTIAMSKSNFLTHCEKGFALNICQQLNKFSDEERCELFALFCKFCGSKNNKCQCWNDE